MEESYDERAKEFSYRIYSLPLEVTNISIRSHAKDINVAPKTYANWMDGSGNTSYIWDANKSFAKFGINPLFYYGSYLHPEIRNANIKPTMEHQRIALKLFLSDTTEEEIQLLHYLKFERHDGKWRHLLQICVADAHLPMDDRVKSTTYICHLYKNSEKEGKLVWNNIVRPNYELVKNATMIGHNAVLGGISGYIGIPSEKEFYVGRISKILQFCREKSHMSKEDMAAAAKCRIETLNNYENDTSYPNFFRLTELIRATGLPVFEVLYGEMYPHPINQTVIGTVSKERQELIDSVDSDADQDVTWLAFLILGQHGGSWHCYLHKIAMLVSLPNNLREDFASFVSVSYRMDACMNRIVCKNQADPKLDQLKIEYYGK